MNQARCLIDSNRLQDALPIIGEAYKIAIIHICMVHAKKIELKLQYTRNKVSNSFLRVLQKVGLTVKS